MDDTTYAPKRVSIPFLFHSTYVEFSMNIRVEGKNVKCIYSTLDDNPCEITFRIKDEDWIHL